MASPGDRPPARLEAVLERARTVGHLGPGPVADHIAHADRFRPALRGCHRVVDLGSGGGVPGLVLALTGSARWHLVEARQRRAAFLETAVADLGLADRVAVVAARAEDAARGQYRGMADAVVARAFGPPPVTAECAVGFLRPGGCLVVSDPPDGGGTGRWPTGGLARLGLSPEATASEGVSVIRLQGRCPDEWPRRSGVPAKRPLF